MISRRPALAGSSKVSRRSKRPGRSRAGSRLSARFVAAISSRLVAGGSGRRSWRCAGRYRLTMSTNLVRSFCSPVGSSNDCICTSSSLTTPPTPSLVIDGLVTEAGRRAVAGGQRRHATAGVDAERRQRLRHRRGRQATAGHGDRVDLLDEADRAALGAGHLAQLLEVRADLARGRAVVHRLERRGGHEEERHAGLARHGLGQVGLAGARRALEQDAAARRAAHVVGERLVGEEEVE